MLFFLEIMSCLKIKYEKHDGPLTAISSSIRCQAQLTFYAERNSDRAARRWKLDCWEEMWPSN